MIDSIKMFGVASYSAPQPMQGLSKVNFVFGSNGSGKTTIAKVLADESAHPTCEVTWATAAKLQVMVYNQDFVRANFGENSELKGIFTLGENSAEAVSAVANAKLEHEQILQNIGMLTATLKGPDGTSGKIAELASLEENCKNTCWEQKVKHHERFAEAFSGHRDKKASFRDRLLKEREVNKAQLLTLESLHKKAETIFGETPNLLPAVSALPSHNLLDAQAAEILSKKVIGKDDVDIASLIRKLGNIDWVRQGRQYFDAAERCPFCQQNVESAFADSLEEFFDDAYEADCATIKTLAEKYRQDVLIVSAHLDAVVLASPRFVDVPKLTAQANLLRARLLTNEERLDGKLSEPSIAIELEHLDGELAEINLLLAQANEQTQTHNKMVTNLAQERRELSSQVWRYLLDVELATYLKSYFEAKTGLDKAIENLSKQIAEAQAAAKAKLSALAKLEEQITSTAPAIFQINKVLEDFAFQGFRLAPSSVAGFYKLQRLDGTDALHTLSEGEKSFITFLYFYNLIKGSASASGVALDRVVVFDDPVSSLDSNVLFVVATLIKGLDQEVRTGASGIKQLFVFTHNVYFHKEVTFQHKRNPGTKLHDETFWMVRKNGLQSTLQSYLSNPVSTSYELLWAEVRSKTKSNLTIQNTLRRIVENYFKILGGQDPDTVCNYFVGEERHICRSLFSWLNDGSHHAFWEDAAFAHTDDATEKYLDVFRKVFDKTGNLGHYKMMMGNDFVEIAATPVGTTPSASTADTPV